MRMRWAVVLLAGVLIGALVASVTWALLAVPARQAEGSDYFIDIVFLEARTDGEGYFEIAHGLDSDTTILGMTVALQHTNGDWHALELSDEISNNFWWNDGGVFGWIHSDAFYEVPVRVLLFVGYPQ